MMFFSQTSLTAHHYMSNTLDQELRFPHPDIRFEFFQNSPISGREFRQVAIGGRTFLLHSRASGSTRLCRRG